MRGRRFIHAMDLDIRHWTGCQTCVMSQYAGKGNHLHAQVMISTG